MFLSEKIKTAPFARSGAYEGRAGMSPLGTDFQTLSINSKHLFTGKNLFSRMHLTAVGGQGDPRPGPAPLQGESPVLGVPFLCRRDGFNCLSCNTYRRS